MDSPCGPLFFNNDERPDAIIDANRLTSNQKNEEGSQNK
jgi:hypothetical protein